MTRKLSLLEAIVIDMNRGGIWWHAKCHIFSRSSIGRRLKLCKVQKSVVDIVVGWYGRYVVDGRGA